jgi:hypothetical protein
MLSIALTIFIASTPFPVVYLIFFFSTPHPPAHRTSSRDPSNNSINQATPRIEITMSENLSFTFSNPTPLCIGDPYKGDDIKRVKADDIDMDDLKNRTKNMITSPGKPGQTISTFSSMPFEYPRLFEGEEWVSKGQVNARNRLLAKKKQVSEIAFKPSSSTKNHACTGDYMGTFSKPWENLPTGMYDKVERRRPTAEEEDAPRSGFYTSPSKKGRGPDMLMGSNRFTYMVGDSDDLFKEIRKKNRMEHDEKIGERRAFRATVFTRNSTSSSNGFDNVYAEDDKCIGISTDPLANVPAKELMEAKQLKEEQQLLERRPFKPAKMKILGGLNPHPAWIPEGERRPGYKKPNLPENLQDRRAFKPTSVPRSGPTSSVAKRGIYKVSG